MSSSVLSTTAPFRAAARQKYFPLAIRAYSGVAASRLHPSHSKQVTPVAYAYVSKRSISSTQQNRTEEYFPSPETPGVKEVQAWAHPVYTVEQMRNVAVAHRDARNWSDKVALGTMRVFRWGMDFVTGYKHPRPEAKHPERFNLTPKQWMNRFIFLESVAGVPGMVGGMLRHLHSLRRMKRDNGWIETLLEEAFNERMHLLTFLKMAEPGWLMRLMVLGAQGVFFNGFFLSYLISPRICHRFVGYLEEEAVITYSRVIKDMENGQLPEWDNLEAPDIAVRISSLYIRADEAKHREVNHTLGNLDQKGDPNPYMTEYKDPTKDHPTEGIENLRATGWERDEIFFKPQEQK
ncbi:Alternative oxidase [Penicillium chermesinum]|nr:Alternative oxidase [Penicillium chermesinum]